MPLLFGKKRKCALGVVAFAFLSTTVVNAVTTFLGTLSIFVRFADTLTRCPFALVVALRVVLHAFAVGVPILLGFNSVVSLGWVARVNKNANNQ